MSNGQRTEFTEWVPVVTWENLAEVCGNNLVKGRKVYVEGRFATRSWEKDGQTHYRTEIVAHKVLFLDKGKGMDHDGGYASQRGADHADGLDQIEAEDLPFE